MTDTIALTSALEDYLEVILELGEKESEIRVTDIADKLNIAKSTVTITINKLKNLGLVLQESYGPVELTSIGKEYAIEVRKRHRLLRKFLVEVLGVDYQTADKDACLMEHVLSPVTMKKIAEYIAQACGTEINPSNNTHSQTGNIDNPMSEVIEERRLRSVKTKALSELKAGDKGRVIRITAPGIVRRRIMDMGVTTGSEIIVKGVAPLGDPLEIMVKGYNLSFRKEDAAYIFVEV